jgi:two-component system LytT family response regulator
VKRIRALVVDDEPLARRGVVQMLAAYPDVGVVGEARSAGTALEAVRALAPDLMFLDIQMPVIDGFDLVGELEASIPLIVFVTAHDAFAVRAYETSAIDYLLKPLQPARFALTMQRVRERLGARAASPYTPAGAPPMERLVVPGTDGLTVLNLAEIDLIEADDYYAAIHARGRRFLIREALSALERRLAAQGFMRVHRSAIVPLARVVELLRESGNGALVLQSGARVPVSRRRMAGVEQALRRLR